jgi:hypothetical protein
MAGDLYVLLGTPQPIATMTATMGDVVNEDQGHPGKATTHTEAIETVDNDRSGTLLGVLNL